jgi:hypothetical protein
VFSSRARGGYHKRMDTRIPAGGWPNQLAASAITYPWLIAGRLLAAPALLGAALLMGASAGAPSARLAAIAVAGGLVTIVMLTLACFGRRWPTRVDGVPLRDLRREAALRARAHLPVAQQVSDEHEAARARQSEALPRKVVTPPMPALAPHSRRVVRGVVLPPLSVPAGQGGEED